MTAFAPATDYKDEWAMRDGVLDARLERRMAGGTLKTYCDAKAVKLDVNTPGYIQVAAALQVLGNHTIYRVWSLDNDAETPFEEYSTDAPEEGDLLVLTDSGEEWIVQNVTDARFGRRFSVSAVKATTNANA